MKQKKMGVSIMSVAAGYFKKDQRPPAMNQEDPKGWRRVPAVYTEGEYVAPITRLEKEDRGWSSLAQALDVHKPKGLGIMLSFAWQLHWYAYEEANKRGLFVAVAMPTNVSALSGLMKSVPIEAVVTTEAGAVALAHDLSQEGVVSQIRLWFIVSPPGTPSAYVAPSGTTVHELLP